MASDIRSLYPYLSNDDLKDYKNNPEQLENLNQFRENDLKKKIGKFSLSEDTFNVEIPPQFTARDELRIVIIGKTGQGKSATANTILGKEEFKEDFTATSVTRESRCVTKLVDGRKISVMDTPGLQDTRQSNESILKELARMTKLYPDGVHAFVYVMNMADPRFTNEDKKVLKLIEKTFGGGFKKYCLLVFSHGDSTLKEVDLDTYRKRQMEIAQVTSGHPTQQNVRKDQRGQNQDKTDFANLLNELSWRMLAIDNKTSIFFEKAHYRKQIVAMVDRMRKLNSPEIYTNDMFDNAKQEREGLRQKGLRKGWDPLIMSKVETMIAANPEISREELNAKVNEELQKENLDKMIALKKKEEEFEKARIVEEKRMLEQKRVDEEKREAEKMERRKRQAKEDQERKERFQKEEQERQNIREREDKEWQSNQEQHKIKRHEQLLREETERKRRVAEEQEKHRQEIQLQLKEFKIRQQRLQEMWEKQVREDQQRSQEQQGDKLKRREEEDSRRMMQIEREKEERQERLRREQIQLEKRISDKQKEESKRQMKINEEQQVQRERREEERKQFELRQTEEREERLRERKEWERRRKEQQEREELERKEKRKQDDKEREERIKREQEEREKAESVERGRIKQAEEELKGLRRDIEKMDRDKRQIEIQTEAIVKEHKGIFEKISSRVASIAMAVVGWFS